MSFTQSALRTSYRFATRGNALRSGRLNTRNVFASRGGVVNEQYPGGVSGYFFFFSGSILYFQSFLTLF